MELETYSGNSTTKKESIILEKTKILIVDDHPENIIALSELIANQIIPLSGMRFDSAALCQFTNEKRDNIQTTKSNSHHK